MGKTSQHDIESIIKLFSDSDWKEIHVKTDSLEIFISDDPSSRMLSKSVKPELEKGKSDTISDKEEKVDLPKNGNKRFEVPEGMFAVRAPNLGTFYRRPKPESDPYIDLGDEVIESSEVCLIEVMKLFTPVKAAISGKVIEILVADGEMVEFDQPLMLIKPT